VRPGAGIWRFISFAVLAVACAGAQPPPAQPPPARAETAATAEESTVVVVRSICGYAFIGNGGAAHFIMDVAGNDFATKAAGENQFYAIDDVIVQVELVSRRQIGAGAAGKSGVGLLRAHKEWEVEHLSSLMRKKVVGIDVVVPIKMDGAARASGLAWWVQLPDKTALGEGLTPPVFLTAELADRVLVLVVQGTKAQPVTELSDRLLDWMRAVTPRADYIPPEQVSADIRRRSAGGEKCVAAPAAG
jgi:hypothetical protein